MASHILVLVTLFSSWNYSLFECLIFYVMDPGLPQTLRRCPSSNLVGGHLHVFRFLQDQDHLPAWPQAKCSAPAASPLPLQFPFRQEQKRPTDPELLINCVSFQIHITVSSDLLKVISQFHFHIPWEVIVSKFCNRGCDRCSNHYFPSSLYSAWHPLEFGKYVLNVFIKE